MISEGPKSMLIASELVKPVSVKPPLKTLATGLLSVEEISLSVLPRLKALLGTVLLAKLSLKAPLVEMFPLEIVLLGKLVLVLLIPRILSLGVVPFRVLLVIPIPGIILLKTPSLRILLAKKLLLMGLVVKLLFVIFLFGALISKIFGTGPSLVPVAKPILALSPKKLRTVVDADAPPAKRLPPIVLFRIGLFGKLLLGKPLVMV
jgi:hypothetical protein